MDKKFNGRAPEGMTKKPERLRSNNATETLEVDALFGGPVTASGSFDFKDMQNAVFGKLLEALPIPTLLLDKDRTIIYANRALSKIGANGPELLGKPFAGLFATPVDTEKALNQIKGILEDRTTRSFEGALRTSKLSFCRLNLRSLRIWKRRAVLVTIEDLTAEKTQVIVSAKYEKLVHIFPIGIAEFAAEPLNGETDIDEAMEIIGDAVFIGGNAQFGMSTTEREVGAGRPRRFRDFFELDRGLRRTFVSWVMDGFPVCVFETKEEGPEGSRRLENTVVADSRQGTVNGFWVLRHDITERKLHEEFLKAAKDKLEEKVQERTAELLRMNDKLLDEIHEREFTEQKLAESVNELQEALAKVKTLSGLLPICASCKKIRDDEGYWTHVEVYVSQHSDADFTHSICPECAHRLYPEYFKQGTFK
jgi:PAS domain S-box-containing protein